LIILKQLPDITQLRLRKEEEEEKEEE